MCLAIPVKIQRVDGHEAVVNIGGVRRSISLWLTPEAQAGDYVILHSGYAISVLDEVEALEGLRLVRELAVIEPLVDADRATAGGLLAEE